mmetsp:Transcript_16054/g.38390  ORF Transcript_16054/g.38390 Transcript_16054/m.38390 type:complete len:304 (-) Transcript_16054:332-1243(-)
MNLAASASPFILSSSFFFAFCCICVRCETRIASSSWRIFSFLALISASRFASASRTWPAIRSFSFLRSDCRYSTCLSIIRCRIPCFCAAISASRSARMRILRSFSLAKRWMRASSSSLACCSAMRFSSCSRLLSACVFIARAASSCFFCSSACFSASMCASTRCLISSPSRRSSLLPATYLTRNSSSCSSCTCFAFIARWRASSLFLSSSMSPSRTASIVRSCHNFSSAFFRFVISPLISICISRSFITSLRYSLLPNAFTLSVCSYSSVFARWIAFFRSAAWNAASSLSITCLTFSSSSILV